MNRHHARSAATLLLLLAGCNRGPDPDALEKARAALSRHDPAAAREVLVRAMKAGLTGGEAHFLNGRALLDTYDAMGAEAEFTKAAAEGVPGARVAPLLAEALFVQGKNDQALARLDAAHLTNSESARIRGRILAAAGDSAGAEAAFTQAIEADARNAPALADRAQFRLANGRAADALADAKRAVEIDGTDPDVLIVRGIVERVSSPKAALPWFERAAAAAPGNNFARLQKAATLDQIGRGKEAAELAEQILKDVPQHPLALAMLASQRLREGNASGARDLVQRAGPAAETTPALMLVAGEAEFKLGNQPRAIDILTRLIAREPGNAAGRRMLAAALWAHGDINGIPQILRPVVERPDADRFSLALMARALTRLGKADQGAAYLGRASLPQGARGVQEGPADASADERTRSVRQIQALAAGRKFAEAETVARQLAGRNPGFVEAQVLLATH
jgi:tetratricopeptide (TPR) repeat protein